MMKKDSFNHSKIRWMPQADIGKKFLLFLFLVMEFILIGAALWPTCWLMLTYAPRANTPTHWVILILGSILVFNYVYLLALLILRIIIPRPREGSFPRRSDGRPPPEALVFMLNILLVKARFNPPWAQLISSVLVNIFPLHYLFRRFFGPDTTSTTLGDTYNCLDPHMVEMGRDVQLGFNCTIISHVYDNQGFLIRKVKIGDHAVIGGESAIMAGSVIGHHSIVGSRTLVPPGTVIKPYEYWAGTPARKIKDLTPEDRICAEDDWTRIKV
ncbi:MAG: hypothetical protein SV375_12710 [Thermodesulfobacteriota bacterium]|nr:hypothetical protein [Thermodesulfobacteriota bacterium]